MTNPEPQKTTPTKPVDQPKSKKQAIMPKDKLTLQKLSNEAIATIIKDLLKDQNVSYLIRVIQYELEAKAEYIKSAAQKEAENLFKIAELLEEPYQKIKNDFHL